MWPVSTSLWRWRTGLRFHICTSCKLVRVTFGLGGRWDEGMLGLKWRELLFLNQRDWNIPAATTQRGPCFFLRESFCRNTCVRFTRSIHSGQIYLRCAVASWRKSKNEIWFDYMWLFCPESYAAPSSNPVFCIMIAEIHRPNYDCIVPIASGTSQECYRRSTSWRNFSNMGLKSNQISKERLGSDEMGALLWIPSVCSVAFLDVTRVALMEGDKNSQTRLNFLKYPSFCNTL